LTLIPATAVVPVITLTLSSFSTESSVAQAAVTTTRIVTPVTCSGIPRHTPLGTSKTARGSQSGDLHTPINEGGSCGITPHIDDSPTAIDQPVSRDHKTQSGVCLGWKPGEIEHDGRRQKR
jgi:hypothetical protein